MKKSLVLFVILALVAGALAAPAVAKKKGKRPARVERVVEAAYSFPSAIGVGAGVCLNCPSVPTGAGETYASVEVIDDNLPTAAVELSWDTDGDGVDDTGFAVCGKTDAPVEVPAATEIKAFAWPVTGAACPGSGATSGMLKITYSNKP